MMNAPEELSTRIKTSFGAMRNILSYLEEKEKTRWQCLDKWFYNVAISRCQVRILTANYYIHEKVYFMK